MHDGEDGRRRADAQRQGKDGDDGYAAAPDERTKGVAEIHEQEGHVSFSLRFALWTEKSSGGLHPPGSAIVLLCYPPISSETSMPCDCPPR
jgi:hypothetical protein